MSVHVKHKDGCSPDRVTTVCLVRQGCASMFMPQSVVLLTSEKVRWHVQEGLANVCLVGASTTLIKAKIEASLPHKRGAAAAGYDKAITSFYDKARTRMRQAVQSCVRSVQAAEQLLTVCATTLGLGHVAGAARLYVL